MLLSDTALAIWNDVAGGAARAFDEWHVSEHMPERLAVPGFLRGRRYVMPGGGRYFTLYETRDKDVLLSPAYLERLNNPTPWSSRIVPLVTSRRRAAVDIVASIGAGVGAALATIEAGPAAGAEERLQAWLTNDGLPAALQRTGIVGAHWGTSDVARSQLDTVEARLMPHGDDVARWVLLVEGIDIGKIDDAVGGLASGIEQHGGLPDHRIEVFVLTNLLEAQR